MAKKKSTRSRSKKSEHDEDTDFEAALADVERIVDDLESGEAGLGESLALYEAGIKRLKQCYGLLENAERQISLLAGFDAEGNPVTEPFDEEAASSERQQASRQRRRRAKDPLGGGAGSEDPEDDTTSVDEKPGLF